MPWPKVPDEELEWIKESEGLEPLYLGPITEKHHRIVAYHRRHSDGSGYPNVTVLMDKKVFDYYEFKALARYNAGIEGLPIWDAIEDIVTSYYWKMNELS